MPTVPSTSHRPSLADHTYDVCVIGAGLSGLTAASLLAKRGLSVCVLEHSHQPGGSCGIFKRQSAIFEQGAAMLYGFGESGYNAHRFVMNALGEPLSVVRHDLLYIVNYEGHRIPFPQDIPTFIDTLAQVFPGERRALEAFYGDMTQMYRDVMVETPVYTTPDEADVKAQSKGFLRHPASYLRFLSYLNKSAKTLLQKYFQNPEIFNFFDKMTSTYSYTTVEESPAILASVMFVDNHFGGSYYPAGSTLFLTGKLEKVIEENGGDLFYRTTATRFSLCDGVLTGVHTQDGRVFHARHFVYSGTVWNLYENLLPAEVAASRKTWARRQEPTYPSLVLYARVKADVIPEGTAPVEMLVGNPASIDESEVTAYILSLDDHTLCAEGEHVVEVIGPSFRHWDPDDRATYEAMKAQKTERLLDIMERRFPGFRSGLLHRELATPATLERYLMKRAVAGPKQAIGQHMFHRLHTRTEIPNLYACGESTVMGTGTPTVTTSGIAAANAVLKKENQALYRHDPDAPNVVTVLTPPVTQADLYPDVPQEERPFFVEARRCQFCEHPRCLSGVPDVLRRLAVGNVVGAHKAMQSLPEDGTTDIATAEARCLCRQEGGEAIAIGRLLDFVGRKADELSRRF